MSKSERKVTVGPKSGSKLSKTGSVFDRLGDSREKHKKWHKKDLDDIEKSSHSTKKTVVESADKTRKKKLDSKHEEEHKSSRRDGSKIVRKKYEVDDSIHFKSYKPISKNHSKSISSEEGHRHRIHKMENLIIEKRVSLSPPGGGSRSDSYSPGRAKKRAKKRQHDSSTANPERLQRYQSKSPIPRSSEKDRGRSREPKKKHVKEAIHKSKISVHENMKYRENTEKYKETEKASKLTPKTEYKEQPKQKKKLKQMKEVRDSDEKRLQEADRTKSKPTKISSKKSQEYYEKDYVYEDMSDDYHKQKDVSHKSTKKVVKKHVDHKPKREMVIEENVIKPKRKKVEAPEASPHRSRHYGSRSQSSDDHDNRREDYKHKTQSSSKHILVKSKQEKVDKYHGGHSKQHSHKEDIAETSSVKSSKKEYYSKSSQGSDDVRDSYSSHSTEESKKKKKLRKKKRKDSNQELKDIDEDRFDEDREDKISEKQNKKVAKKRLGKRKRDDRSPSYSDSGEGENPRKQQHSVMLEKGKHHKKDLHTGQDYRDEERNHKQIDRQVEEKRISPVYRSEKFHSRLEEKVSDRGQQDRHGKEQYRDRVYPKHVPEKLRTSEYPTPQHHHHHTYMKSVKRHQISVSEWHNDTERKPTRHVRPPVSSSNRHYETHSSKFIPQRKMLDPTYPPPPRKESYPRSHSKDDWERNREPAPSRRLIHDQNAPRSRSRSGFSPSKYNTKHIYSQQEKYESTRREREFESTSRNNSNERQQHVRDRQLRSKSRDSRSSSQRVDRVRSPHQRSSTYSDRSDHYERHHDVDSVGHRLKKPLKSKDSMTLSNQEKNNSSSHNESEVILRSQEDYDTKVRKYKVSRSGSSHHQSSEKLPPKLDDVYRGSKNQRPQTRRHESQRTRTTHDRGHKPKPGSSQGEEKVKRSRDSTLGSAADKKRSSSSKLKKDVNDSSEMGDKELGLLIESDNDKTVETDVLDVGWNELPSQELTDQKEAKPRSSVLEKFSPGYILSQTGIVSSLLRPDILEKVKEIRRATIAQDNVNKTTSVKAILNRGLNIYAEENVRKRLLGCNTRYRHPLVPPFIINAKTYMAAMKTYKSAVKMQVETM